MQAQIVGSLSKHDNEDDNCNVKKKKKEKKNFGLMTIALNGMHYAFQYTSLASTVRLLRESSLYDFMEDLYTNPPYATFMEDLNIRQRYCFLFLKLDKGPQEFNPRRNRPHLTNQAGPNRRKFIFLVTFSKPSSSSQL